MPCRFCEAISLAGKTYCEKCRDDILERYPTMPVIALADEYGISRNALISIWNRNKPDDAKAHPGAMHASIASRRRNKLISVALDEVHRPNITDRQKIGVCRWIDHEGEVVYGEAPEGAAWEYCQRPRLRGKQYCAHHYPRTVRPKEQKSKFVNNIKGSARLPQMAYA